MSTDLMAVRDLPAPHSSAAEWSVLSKMLHEPKCIGEVIGVPLAQEDFSQPDTRLIFQSSIERYYANQPVDALIVGEQAHEQLAAYWNAEPMRVAELLVRRARESYAISGELLEHAQIVKRLSTSRQLMNVCHAAVAALHDGKITPEEVGDQLSTNALQITAGTMRRSEIMDWMDTGREYVKHLQRVIAAKQQGVEIGVYTGLSFIDKFTTGIAPGELCFIAGEPGVGKLLALSTLLPTPTGWTTMGEVERGDVLCDERGRATRVTAISDVKYGEDVYELRFSDGATVKASGTHTWVVSSRRARQRVLAQAHRQRTGKRNRPPDPLVLEELTTAEIAAAVRTGWDDRANYAIQLAEPLKGHHRKLPMDPYVLGCWLAEGSTTAAVVTLGDAQIVSVLQDRGASVKVRDASRPGGGLRLSVSLSKPTGVAALRAAGVLGYKHIPPTYLRASEDQRWALLAGIADGDGWSDDGGCEITTVLPRLRDDIYELATSLGCAVYVNEGRAKLDGRDYGPKWNVRFQSARCPFWIERKASGWTPRRLGARYIVDVKRIASEPVKCLAVEAPSHLYLCGRAMIPTHNTAVAWSAAMGFAGRQLSKPQEQRVGTLMLSMEMGVFNSTARVVSAITGINSVALREGQVSKDQFRHILQEWKSREELPMYFNFASNFRLSQMRALVAEAIRRANVGFVVIDHFRMIDTDRQYSNPNQEDEAKVRFLKENLAKDLNVAVMCLAHTAKVGRGQGGESPKPRLTDLRGSGMIAAHADFVGFLWSSYKYMSTEARRELFADPGDMELSWEKNRYGTSDSAELKFEPETMRVYAR